jgi:hypothetical protein
MLMDLGEESPGSLRIRVALLVPDQDLSRLHATTGAQGAEGHRLSPAARMAISESVGSLLELLRALGGESSAASVDLEVRCALGVAPSPGSPPKP